jgi:hypothetical protein
VSHMRHSPSYEPETWFGLGLGLGLVGFGVGVGVSVVRARDLGRVGVKGEGRGQA